MKKILILGSTGSIGKQTLDVIKKFPKDLEVVGLACYSQAHLILKQAKGFNVKRILIFDRTQKNIAEWGSKTKVFFGEENLAEFITKSGANIVVNAIVGAAGIKSTVVAIKAKKNIALANKESLVCAGEIIMSLAQKNKINIFPIDSEHSAIWQCLRGEDRKKIGRIILTCSGGPFFGKSREELKKVTFQDAINHPKWKMGSKISIDSATLMNKGFEIIEACHLFGVDIDKIEVVIHRESVVHSMVEFYDNSIKAQIAVPDMRLPIQYALFYPERKTQVVDSVNFEKMNLTFQKPDVKLFPNLNYAIKAFKIGGTMPAVLNAANEEVMKLFSQGKIRFLDIARINNATMRMHKSIKKPTLNDIFSSDKWARKIVKKLQATSYKF